MRVLHIEDNPADTDQTRRTLARADPLVSIETAVTLAEARARLEAVPGFDAALLDLRLPDGSGLELLAWIRERHIPIAVVVLTGSGDPDSALAALKAGADDYLAKDYLSRLPATLADAVQRYRETTVRHTRTIRVLYAEHNIVDIELTRKHLAEHAPHIRLTVVPDATVLLDMLPTASGRDLPFDVLLLDYRLPGVDALDALKQIRQERRLDVPIILVTGNGNEEVVAQAFRLGVSEYLFKRPGYLHELPWVIEKAQRGAELIRQQAEMKKLSQAVEHSPASVVISDHSGHIEYVNPKFTSVTGYSQEEVAGRNFRLLQSGEMSPTEYEALWRTVTSGGTWRGEFRNRKKNGDFYWEYASISPIVDNEGGITHFVAVKEDMTEQKQAALALQQSEEKFREFFMTSRDCVFITTPAGELVDFNDAALTLFGFDSREELTRVNVQDLYATSEDRVDIVRLVVARGYLQDHPVTLRRRSGALVDVLVTSSALRYADGTVRALVGTIRDISEQKKAEGDRVRLEAQLQQAQKMDAIGRLAGGVAHDFNNMLNVILGYADMVIDKLPPSDALLDDLQQIRVAALRSADLIGQLLAFARKQTVAPKVLDLNAVIGERAKMLRRLIGEDIAFSVVPGADLGSVSIDPSQLDQVLANLSVNSRDAIGGVGSIIIETRNVECDEAYCAEHPGFRIGDFVQLAFSDTGCGMDSERLSRIFEPFFTTKETGMGTGLGLATVYGIVKQNGGFINVYSEPGQGTTFRIYLPRHDDAVTEREAQRDDPLVTGSETILVVEDEGQILRMCQRVLEEAGYTVLAATGPVSALMLAEQHPSPIHLLLSDVVMPTMNGKQLQARIEAVAPGIRTVFMSGYTADVVTHRGVLDEGTRFLQKPFSRLELARRVREALDET